MQLVQYRLADGQIHGLYDSENQALLDAQRQVDDPTYGYILAETPLPPQEQERYEVQSGVIVAKAQLVIEADPLTFAADGIDECLVTVEPWHACTLLVNGQPYALTNDEPFLAITADVPRVFGLRLQLMPGYWATPISVEAVPSA